MPIAKGEPWGRPGALPDDGVVVDSDAEAGRVIRAARASGTPVPALGLRGGDLFRTLGGRAGVDRVRTDEAMTMSCDLGVALVDGRIHWFVAHLALRRGWWRGRAVVVMNAAWMGEWNLAPRSHPNDGQLDVTEAAVPVGQRLAVRSRLPQGAHVPHPAIRTYRTRAAQWHFERAVPVRLDGELVGVAHDVSVHVEPDALTVVV